MKISKVILLVAAAVVLAAIVIFAVLLHHTIQTRRAVESEKFNYKTLPVTEFSKVALSGHFNARIRQGKVCAVEYACASDSLIPVINNINGTLNFSVDSSAKSSILPVLNITMPRVFEITAIKGTEISMGFFSTDSIRIVLGEGTMFNGNDNTFKKVNFTTSGNAVINLSSTF